MKPPSPGSGSLQSLLESARSDAPSTSAREAMWSRIEVGIVPPPVPSGARAVRSKSTPPSAAPPPPSTSSLRAPPPAVITPSLKAGLIGGSIGSCITVALLLAARATLTGAPVLAEGEDSVSTLSQLIATDRATDETARSPAASVLTNANAMPSSADSPTTRAASLSGGMTLSVMGDPLPNDRDALGLETALIMRARAALLRGDPQRALAQAAQARSMRGQLEKEALILELRSLRAMGRDPEADRVEMELRVLHPSLPRAPSPGSNVDTADE